MARLFNFDLWNDISNFGDNMKSTILKMLAGLITFANKVLPSAKARLEFNEKIFELQAMLRNSNTIDNITYIIVVNWFVAVPIKCYFIADYLTTILFKADIVSFALALSFQFGIEFKDILKAMSINKEKKRSRK